eukprot:CAMPEP_0182856136 /NCGR_PEP_ID=MMETSP0034_2-20130328/2255_1 /TAXON_ID=156128 /ORGANISM="Nephroselmis pyriformis, Strain CCMP717" /LENGTH=361 /DNA_ID=CAMNT_0024987179 /DNA_START=413 /DNA_END=1498 /DNA_ORIENTATION=+
MVLFAALSSHKVVGRASPPRNSLAPCLRPRPKFLRRRESLPPAVTRASAGARGDALYLEDRLREVDRLLASKDEKAAAALASDLAGTEEAPGPLLGFGRAKQTPKRLYTIEELRLNRVEPEKYLSPEDKTLGGVRDLLKAAYAAGLAALYFGAHLDAGHLVSVVAGSIFLLGVDQIGNMGAGESLLMDTVGRVLKPEYPRRVAAHEAGHFLVSYLVGILPSGYTLSGLDAIRRYGAINVQAGCTFCDGDFQAEVARGQLSSASLDRYCCIALAGVATEYLVFGQAEGGLSDIQQLDRLLQALGFTQKKSDGQVRWAVLNTTVLLQRHRAAHRALTEAMVEGRPVGECVRVIEEELAKCKLI